MLPHPQPTHTHQLFTNFSFLFIICVLQFSCFYSKSTILYIIKFWHTFIRNFPFKYSDVFISNKMCISAVTFHAVWQLSNVWQYTGSFMLHYYFLIQKDTLKLHQPGSHFIYYSLLYSTLCWQKMTFACNIVSVLYFHPKRLH